MIQEIFKAIVGDNFMDSVFQGLDLRREVHGE